MYKIVLIVLFILTIVFVSSLPSVAFSKQVHLLDSLKQISSIILAITGAWAAIVYPDSLKNIIYKKKSSIADMQSIKNLIRPMISSILILAIIILIEISAFILKLYSISVENIQLLRSISLVIIIYLYLLQLWTLIIAIIPINNSYRNAKNEDNKNNLIDRLHKNTKS